MIRFHYDSSILVEIVSQSADRRCVEQHVARCSGTRGVSIIALGELIAIAAKRGWEEKKQERWRSFVKRNLQVVQLDPREHAVSEYSRLYRQIGKTADAKQIQNDSWIVVCAAIDNATIVTKEKRMVELAATLKWSALLVARGSLYEI